MSVEALKVEVEHLKDTVRELRTEIKQFREDVQDLKTIVAEARVGRNYLIAFLSSAVLLGTLVDTILRWFKVY